MGVVTGGPFFLRKPNKGRPSELTVVGVKHDDGVVRHARALQPRHDGAHVLVHVADRAHVRVPLVARHPVGHRGVRAKGESGAVRKHDDELATPRNERGAIAQRLVHGGRDGGFVVQGRHAGRRGPGRVRVAEARHEEEGVARALRVVDGRVQVGEGLCEERVVPDFRIRHVAVPAALVPVGAGVGRVGEVGEHGRVPVGLRIPRAARLVEGLAKAQGQVPLVPKVARDCIRGERVCINEVEHLVRVWAPGGEETLAGGAAHGDLAKGLGEGKALRRKLVQVGRHGGPAKGANFGVHVVRENVEHIGLPSL